MRGDFRCFPFWRPLDRKLIMLDAALGRGWKSTHHCNPYLLQVGQATQGTIKGKGGGEGGGVQTLWLVRRGRGTTSYVPFATPKCSAMVSAV